MTRMVKAVPAPYSFQPFETSVGEMMMSGSTTSRWTVALCLRSWVCYTMS